MKKVYSQKEKSELIIELIKDCTTYIEKGKYKDFDIRNLVFANIRGIAYSTLAITNLLDKLSIENQQIGYLIGIELVDIDSVQLMGDRLDKFCKLNLCTLSQFQIENCIVHLNEKLNIPKDFYPNKQIRIGFYNQCYAIGKYLKIDDFQNQKMKTFMTGAHIRNSLHSNGIHTNTTFNHKINKLDYNFVKDQRISGYATLIHITNAIIDSLMILKLIIDLKEIMKFDLIEDKYAKSIENTNNNLQKSV